MSFRDSNAARQASIANLFNSGANLAATRGNLKAQKSANIARGFDSLTDSLESVQDMFARRDQKKLAERQMGINEREIDLKEQQREDAEQERLWQQHFAEATLAAQNPWLLDSDDYAKYWNNYSKETKEEIAKHRGMSSVDLENQVALLRKQHGYDRDQAQWDYLYKRGLASLQNEHALGQIEAQGEQERLNAEFLWGEDGVMREVEFAKIDAEKEMRRFEALNNRTIQLSRIASGERIAGEDRESREGITAAQIASEEGMFADELAYRGEEAARDRESRESMAESDEQLRRDLADQNAELQKELIGIQRDATIAISDAEEDARERRHQNVRVHTPWDEQEYSVISGEKNLDAWREQYDSWTRMQMLDAQLASAQSGAAGADEDLSTAWGVIRGASEEMMKDQQVSSDGRSFNFYDNGQDWMMEKFDAYVRGNDIAPELEALSREIFKEWIGYVEETEVEEEEEAREGLWRRIVGSVDDAYSGVRNYDFRESGRPYRWASDPLVAKPANHLIDMMNTFMSTLEAMYSGGSKNGFDLPDQP